MQITNMTLALAMLGAIGVCIAPAEPVQSSQQPDEPTVDLEDQIFLRGDSLKADNEEELSSKVDESDLAAAVSESEDARGVRCSSGDRRKTCFCAVRCCKSRNACWCC